MTKLKTYDVIVKTKTAWYGEVQAKSLRTAKRLAEAEFDEGNLRQIGEECEEVIAFKPRKRCGSWRTFERRFQPLPAPNHDVLWELRGEVPADADYRYWWTVVDCDGRLYVTPGFRFVNRFAYIRCAVPWTDDDERQPDYVYQ